MGFTKLSPKERQTEIKKMSRGGLSYVKGDIETFTPLDGDNKIRILPAIDEDPYTSLWGMEIRTYFLRNKFYLAPNTFNPDAENYAQKAFFHLREEDEKLASQFRGVRRYLMWILDLNDEDNPKLKLWAAPPTLIQEFTKLSRNRRTGALIPIEDPKEGRIIFFEKSGSGLATKYEGVEVDKDEFPINPELYKKVRKLEDVLIVSSEEELEKVVNEILDDASGDDDDEEEEEEEDVEESGEEDEPKNEEEGEVDDEIPFEGEEEKESDKEEPEEKEKDDDRDSALKARINKKLNKTKKK